MVKNNKSKKELKIPNIFMLLISVILIMIAYLLGQGGILRLILWLLGVILLIVNIMKTYSTKFGLNLIIFICLFIVSIFIDGMVSMSLKKIPLFAYNIINTGNARVYNGIGIRVWQCDKNNYKDLIIDPFYNKGYICNSDTIPAVEINPFLNSVIENYDDYKNSYIKINGKVSKKTGQNYIEMKPYETTSVTINGYVTFADNIVLRILFNENEKELDNYDVYDEITIIGIVKNLEQENNNYAIYMYDSKVVSNVDLNQYEISVTEENTCSNEPNIIYSNEAMNIYTYCIDDMIINYPNDKKYELGVALSSNKITVNELFEKSTEIIPSEVDGSMIYSLEKYNVLVCDTALSKDVFIGSKTMTFSNVTCSPKNEETEIPIE